MTNYWIDKSVLICGGSGFVGIHLTTLLRNAGASVTVLDNFSRGQNKIPRVRYLFGDCSIEGTCRDWFKNQQIVLNLAAEVAGVQYNQSHHAEMFRLNLNAQMMPLRIAAEYGVEKFLHTSSVCIYSPHHNNPCQEHNGFEGTPTGANIGYSLAKRMGERYAMWVGDTGLDVVRVRPSNIFGPHDYDDEKAHVIPALIRKCVYDDEIIVNGTGQESREFIYVTDVARGMMAAVERGKPGEVYNLGTNATTCVSISYLVERIREMTNQNHKPIQFKDQFDAGDNVRWSDAVKANTELDWYHQVGILDGLEKTIEWYLDRKDQQ